MTRGRLSKIQLLPEECEPVVAWAAAQLQDSDRTQVDIYAEFVDKLRAVEADHRGELVVDIPSFQAFNRYSIRLAAISQRMTQMREIASTLAEKFDTRASDDLTVITAEAIKSLILELLTASGRAGIEPKGVAELARALQAANQAQSVSTDRRKKIEASLAAKAEAAIEEVTKATGGAVSGDIIARFRRELGIDKEGGR